MWLCTQVRTAILQVEWDIWRSCAKLKESILHGQSAHIARRGFPRTHAAQTPEPVRGAVGIRHPRGSFQNKSVAGAAKYGGRDRATDCRLRARDAAWWAG